MKCKLKKNENKMKLFATTSPLDYMENKKFKKVFWFLAKT